MVADERRVALVQAFADSRTQLLDAIAGLSTEALTEPALDGWSVQDHLSHIVHMDELRFLEILRVAHGYQVAYPALSAEQSDTLNALGVEPRRRLSLTQVLWELESARGRVLEAIQHAPEAALDPFHYGEFGLDGGVGHEQDHAATIRRWRESRGL